MLYGIASAMNTEGKRHTADAVKVQSLYRASLMHL